MCKVKVYNVSKEGAWSLNGKVCFSQHEKVFVSRKRSSWSQAVGWGLFDHW